MALNGFANVPAPYRTSGPAAAGVPAPALAPGDGAEAFCMETEPPADGDAAAGGLLGGGWEPVDTAAEAPQAVSSKQIIRAEGSEGRSIGVSP